MRAHGADPATLKYFLRAAAHLRAAKMRRAGWERREPVLVASPLTTAFVTARSAATGRRRACRPMLCPFPYKSRAAAKFCRVGKEMARILPPLSRHRRRTRAPSDDRTEGASTRCTSAGPPVLAPSRGGRRDGGAAAEPPTPVRFDDGALALTSLALPPVAPLCAAAADFPEPRPALPAPQIYSVTDAVDCQALTPGAPLSAAAGTTLEAMMNSAMSAKMKRTTAA